MSYSFLPVKKDCFLSRNSILFPLFFFAIFLSWPFDSVAQMRLAWAPNTEPDIAGYQVYYGMTSRNYKHSIDVGNVTTYTLLGLKQGVTYYVALTAYDSANNESAFSNEVSGKVDETVSAPTVLSGPMSGDPSGSYTYTTLVHTPRLGMPWNTNSTGPGKAETFLPGVLPLNRRYGNRLALTMSVSEPDVQPINV